MIIVIIITCLILYKSGLIVRLLDTFRLEPETLTAPEPTPPQKEITDREQLEIQARYILTYQGYDHPETVEYMGDTMLMQIINNYCKN
jgi:hypothetical protein